MKGINLNNSIITNSSFKNVDMSGLSLIEINFGSFFYNSGAIREINLNKVNINRGTLLRSTLRRIKVENSNFVGSNLSRADLSYSIFSNSDMSNSNLFFHKIKIFKSAYLLSASSIFFYK